MDRRLNGKCLGAQELNIQAKAWLLTVRKVESKVTNLLWHPHESFYRFCTAGFIICCVSTTEERKRRGEITFNLNYKSAADCGGYLPSYCAPYLFSKAPQTGQIRKAAYQMHRNLYSEILYLSPRHRILQIPTSVLIYYSLKYLFFPDVVSYIPHLLFCV